MRPLYIVVMLTALLNVPVVWAEEGLAVHGALTQGVFTSDKNDFYGDTSSSASFEYTQASINLSFRPLPKLRLAGQFIYQNVGGIKSDEVDVDYLFADWQIFSGLDSTVGFRFGRFKNPLGLYNETSDIIFTRPSILLPQSVYPESARNVLLSTDGLLIYSDLFTDSGEYHFFLGYGLPRVDETPRLPIDENVAGKIRDEWLSVAGAYFESSSGAWKVGATGMYGGSDYEYFPTSIPLNVLEANLAAFGVPPGINAADIVDGIQIGQVKGEVAATTIVAFIQYLYADWTFTAEHIWQNFDAALDPVSVSVIPGFFPVTPPPVTVDPSVDYWSDGYYLQIEKRFNPRFSGFLRWDVRYEDRDDKNGSEYSATYGIPRYFAFGKDASIGMRWDITENFMFNAELHFTDGTNWIPLSEGVSRQDQSRYWNLAAAALSYRF